MIRNKNHSRLLRPGIKPGYQVVTRVSLFLSLNSEVRVDYFNSPLGSGTEELRSWTNIEKVLITVGDNGYNFIGIKKDGRLVSTIESFELHRLLPRRIVIKTIAITGKW